jgi:hypothetical protein
MFFSPILSDDIQLLIKDRVRYGTEDNKMNPVLDTIPTPFGSIGFGVNRNAGPNKMFFVKGRIQTKGDPIRKPGRPTFTVAAAAAPGSKFEGTDAGNYIYQVFAVNNRGISEANMSASVPVAAGNGVTITISPNATIAGTGYIICRSARGGNDPMEMVRIPRNPDGNTVIVDLNEDLPGTTDLIVITEKKLQTVAEFYQLNPMRLFRMNPVNRLVSPFILALWGVLDLKNPEWCALIKNIGYKGGLYA